MKRLGRPPQKFPVSFNQKQKLIKLINAHKSEQRKVLRAKIIMLSYAGKSLDHICNKLKCARSTVVKWRKRWREFPDVENLKDAYRSGAPAKFNQADRAAVISAACSRPDGKKTPFRNIHTYQSVADTFSYTTGKIISRSEVRRILSNKSIRPQTVRYWLNSQDPKFYEKAKEVCELYLNPPKNSCVLCVDEKPIQVISRKYPNQIDSRTGAVRKEYEYKRNGTQTLLGCFNVSTGEVYGWVKSNRKADTLVSFMHSVADFHPDKEIHIIWDNLNIHKEGKNKRWTEFNEIQGRRIHLHYTPIHASWLNQIECWFSILERRVLKNGSFSSCSELARRVEDYIEYWNNYESHPFNWKFRPKKGKNKPERISRAA